MFAATAINYIDQQMIGVLKPTLAADLDWSETNFANVIFFFQMAYALGYIGSGRVVDIIGERPGNAVAFTIWTEELAYITQDRADPVVPVAWKKLLTVRENWAHARGKLFIDPIWWFYLFWLPGFLGKRYDLDLLSFGPQERELCPQDDDAGMRICGAASVFLPEYRHPVAQFLHHRHGDGGASGVSRQPLYLAVRPVLRATPAERSAIGGMIMANYADFVLDSIGSCIAVFAVVGSAYFLALAAAHVLS